MSRLLPCARRRVRTLGGGIDAKNTSREEIGCAVSARSPKDTGEAVNARADIARRDDRIAELERLGIMSLMSRVESAGCKRRNSARLSNTALTTP
jgi:hypothetical protein